MNTSQTVWRYGFRAVVFAFAAIFCFTQFAYASSLYGHYGQAIYLFAVEMPDHSAVYKPILGDELFAMLTNEVSDGKYNFDLDHMNKPQKAFIAGTLGPDIFDHIWRKSSTVHRDFPQGALNAIFDLVQAEEGERLVIARGFFFGWAFHYVTDLVIHPGMNQTNPCRVGRVYDDYPAEHVIYEGLIDRISIQYFFLLHREKGVAPSKVISKAGITPGIPIIIEGIPHFISRMKSGAKYNYNDLCTYVKGIFNSDSKNASKIIQANQEKLKILDDTFYDKSLKAFFAQTLPEDDLMSGKANLSDYFPGQPLTESKLAQEISGIKADISDNSGESRSTSSSSGVPTSGVSPFSDGNAKITVNSDNSADSNAVPNWAARIPIPQSSVMCLESNLSDCLGWWRQIMRNTPDGFRKALNREGFAFNLYYGIASPTLEPEVTDKDLIGLRHVYDPAVGRKPSADNTDKSEDRDN
ncbi:MAG: zinc dependent phospholipase C family protein [Candidatus Riflebacteria bacterium]|nr:zinc dependent phospholipase C family protein [Candidatus Riflebacteria bacterium]